MIRGILARLRRNPLARWLQPAPVLEATEPGFPVPIARGEVSTAEGPIPPVYKAEGFSLLWKVSDAVVMWLSHPDRINGRFTCAEIAAGINEDRVYAFENWSQGNLKDTAVNAAMSGISIRAARPGHRYVTDIAPEASVHTRPEEGLRTPWRKRLWSLTPLGIAHARQMSEIKSEVTRRSEDMQKRRAAGEF